MSVWGGKVFKNLIAGTSFKNITSKIFLNAAFVQSTVTVTGEGDAERYTVQSVWITVFWGRLNWGTDS